MCVMKNYLPITILLFSLLAFSGCKTQQPAASTIETHYVELVRDSTVVIPPDSAWLKALLECDSTGKVYLRQLLDYRSGEHVKPPAVRVRNNELTASCKVDSFGVFFAWVQKYGLKSTEVRVPVEVPVETPVRDWIWWVGLAAVLVASIAVAGFVLWRTPLLKWLKTVFKII